MPEVLDNLVIKICEKFPFNIAPFEKYGFCEKPNEYCDYCRKNGADYLCNKKTYISIQESKFV